MFELKFFSQHLQEQNTDTGIVKNPGENFNRDIFNRIQKEYGKFDYNILLDQINYLIKSNQHYVSKLNKLYLEKLVSQPLTENEIKVKRNQAVGILRFFYAQYLLDYMEGREEYTLEQLDSEKKQLEILQEQYKDISKGLGSNSSKEKEQRQDLDNKAKEIEKQKKRLTHVYQQIMRAVDLIKYYDAKLQLHAVENASKQLQASSIQSKQEEVTVDTNAAQAQDAANDALSESITSNNKQENVSLETPKTPKIVIRVRDSRPLSPDDMDTIVLNVSLDAGDSPYIQALWFSLMRKLVTLLDTIRKYSIAAFSYMNNYRLYWTWTGYTEAFCLHAFFQSFKNYASTIFYIGIPGMVCGILSWAFYWSRLALDILPIIPHLLGVTPEEKQTDFWKRFTSHFFRDDTDLWAFNDGPWSFANFICNRWLCGTQWRDFLGNIVTGALLVMDIMVCSWMLHKHMCLTEEFIVNLQEERNDLEKALKEILLKIDDDELKEKLKNPLFEESERADRIKKVKILTDKEIQYLLEFFKDNTDEKVKVESLIREYNDKGELILAESKNNEKVFRDDFICLVYACSLAFAFSLACCMFFPPSLLIPAVALGLTLTGAALCSAFAIIQTLISDGANLMDLRNRIKESKENLNTLANTFNTSTIPHEKRKIYNEMQILAHEIAYQEKLFLFEGTQVAFSTFVKVGLPIFTAVALLMLTTPIIGIPLGIFIIGAVLAFAVGAKLMMHFALTPKPTPAEELEFDEEDYKKVISNEETLVEICSGKILNFKQPDPKPELAVSEEETTNTATPS